MEGGAQSLLSCCWLPGLDGVHWPACPILDTQGKKNTCQMLRTPSGPQGRIRLPAHACHAHPRRAHFPAWTPSGTERNPCTYPLSLLAWLAGVRSTTDPSDHLQCSAGAGAGLQEASASLLLSVLLGMVSRTGLWAFPPCIPSGTPRGSLLDTCSHQQHGAHHPGLSGGTCNLLCQGSAPSG